MIFYIATNNNVTAVISSEHAKLYASVKNAGGDPIKAGARVFTFCSKQRLDDSDTARLFFTGSHQDLATLVKLGGHQLVDSCEGWDGYVPFSNHLEFRNGQLAINPEEAKFACNLYDVLAVFGQASVTK